MKLLDSDRHFTSPTILAAVAEQWPEGISLDPCWDPESIVVADKVFDARNEEDGLLLPWTAAGRVRTLAPRVWCNPPWSATGPWCMRAAQHGAQGGEVLLFLPASTDTVAVQTYVLPHADICLLASRPKFSRPSSDKLVAAMTPCMIAYFGPHRDVFARVFSKIGTIVRRVEPPVLEVAA